jgi:hypothetical protein
MIIVDGPAILVSVNRKPLTCFHGVNFLIGICLDSLKVDGNDRHFKREHGSDIKYMVQEKVKDVIVPELDVTLPVRAFYSQGGIPAAACMKQHQQLLWT